MLEELCEQGFKKSSSHEDGLSSLSSLVAISKRMMEKSNGDRWGSFSFEKYSSSVVFLFPPSFLPPPPPTLTPILPPKRMALGEFLWALGMNALASFHSLCLFFGGRQTSSLEQVCFTRELL